MFSQSLNALSEGVLFSPMDLVRLFSYVLSSCASCSVLVQEDSKELELVLHLVRRIVEDVVDDPIAESLVSG